MKPIRFEQSNETYPSFTSPWLWRAPYEPGYHQGIPTPRYADIDKHFGKKRQR